jgi:cyclic beta-1,2-glucan synthetase
MHRAAIESICGLRVQQGRVSLRPQLPSHWPRVSITVRREGRRHEFIVCSAEAARGMGLPLLAVGEWLSLDGLQADSVHVVMASAAAPADAGGSLAAANVTG